jgi:hypothetical protein
MALRVLRGVTGRTLGVRSCHFEQTGSPQRRTCKTTLISIAWCRIGTSTVGWAIERDGKIWRTGPRLEVLGAWLDAFLAGASSYDADDIAEVIERRSQPSYEERRAVFKPSGRPEPSREPFPIVSKGGGRPAF